MDCIIISKESFLVDTTGEKGQLANEIVCINTTKTTGISTFDGETSENVPVYTFLKRNDWDKATKTFPIVPLNSRPDLENLYAKVFNAHEAQFESVEDFILSNRRWPTNV